MISSSEADLTREIPKQSWAPNKKLIKSLRDYQKFKYQSSLVARIMCKIAVLRHRFWSIITAADIPINSNIGGGLIIPHPNGIVIHPNSVIGVNCLIHQQVTIGVNRNSNIPPKIGGHVDIGAGAKIIGNITVGEHALIGANAVVVKDVEPYSIVAGVPAKVIGYTNRQRPLPNES